MTRSIPTGGRAARGLWDISAAAVSVLLLVASPGAARSETATIRVDCRVGFGMMPTGWRAVSVDASKPAVDPGGELIGARVPESLIQQAWTNPAAWKDVEAVLSELSGQRLRVLLSLPPPAVEELEDWLQRVAETVTRVGKDVALFELGAGPATGEAYLAAYEAAVWAIYRADPEARVGGPGAFWEADGHASLVEALAQRCQERRLPLHFLSWRLAAGAPDHMATSIADASAALKRHPQEAPPELVISEWSVDPGLDGAAPETALASLKALLNPQVSLACARIPVPAAFSAFESLGSVQMATTVESESPVVTTVATMAGEEFRALLWTRSPLADVTLLITGLRPGPNAVISRRVQGGQGEEIQQTVAMTQPLKLQFPVRQGSPVDVRVRVP